MPKFALVHGYKSSHGDAVMSTIEILFLYDMGNACNFTTQ